MGINPASREHDGTMISQRFPPGFSADTWRTNQETAFLLAGAFAWMPLVLPPFSCGRRFHGLRVSHSIRMGTGAPHHPDYRHAGRYFGRKAFGSILGTANLCDAGGHHAPVLPGGFLTGRELQTAFAHFWHSLNGGAAGLFHQAALSAGKTDRYSSMSRERSGIRSKAMTARG